MRELPLGWATDIAVLEQIGSNVDDRGDHLIVRTPHRPTFHWGNCVFVLAPGAVDDAARWVQVFGDAFPAATWVAIGLPRMPDDVDAWSAYGVELEVSEALATRTVPRQTAPPDGYSVRPLAGDDWDQAVELAIVENRRTSGWEGESYATFARDRARGERDLSERGVAAFFGAFAGDALVASLGIVRFGTTARYQDVGTDADHRRRGLASHLLGVAARWARDRGCERWVIVTEATNPAGRIYRSVGFELDSTTVEAYRRRPL